MSSGCMTDLRRAFYSRYAAQQLMKKLFSMMGELSAKRFVEFNSDWPNVLYGSQALARGHRIIMHLTPYFNGMPK